MIKMSDEKDNNIKINIPLFTNLELEEFDFKLDNYLDSIVQEVSKAVLHDKENILLQKVIQKLQKELEQEKEKNKELENADLTTVYMNGFYDGEKQLENKIKAKIEYYRIIDNTVGMTILEEFLR